MKDYPVNRLRNWFVGALRSLTIWVNSAFGIFIVALPDLQNTLPQLTAYLPPDVYKWLALGLVLSNVLLRAKTKYALSEKGQP